MKVQFCYEKVFNNEMVFLNDVEKINFGMSIMSITLKGFKKALLYSIKRVSKLIIES